MGHHAEALGGVDQYDVVGHMGAGFRRGGARHDGGGVDRALAACRLLGKLGRATERTKAATKILRLSATAAGLIDDRLHAIGPVGRFCHQTRSRNMLTWEDSTPPSPCSSATEASRTWRLPARPVICRWVSTKCAMAPPTPQWP